MAFKDLPAWVRAKIIKTNQLKRDVENAFFELCTSPPVGRTIQVTPRNKAKPMSEAALRKEKAWADSKVPNTAFPGRKRF